VKRSLLQEVRAINPKNVTMISVRQAEAKGLGHAISCAKPAIGNNPFVIMLPDVIIDKYHSDLGVENLASMIKRFSSTGENQIMVNPVPTEQVSSYGVVDLGGEIIAAGEGAAITDMVEKPERDKAPSNLAITGRYVVSETIWDLLEKTLPGAGGEIQLTDALDELLKLEPMSAYHIVGKTHDCGSKLGFIKANIEYSMQRKEFQNELGLFMEELIADPSVAVNLTSNKKT